MTYLLTYLHSTEISFGSRCSMVQSVQLYVHVAYLAANAENESNLRDSQFPGVRLVDRRFFIYSRARYDIPSATVDVVGQVDLLLTLVPT